ncbi:MAG TPA: NADH-quinone oxidoreductase subunit N [Longimicrobiaceae bacterium]|nr:NADH-quinone oxidoreductase subunit N [Longimicrobiaceae bacterium]
MTLQFTSQTDYFWALLPEIVLSLWAMLVLLIDVFQKGHRSGPSRPIIAWLSLAGVVPTALANLWLMGPARTASPGGMVAADDFAIFTNFIILLAAALSILLSIGHVDEEEINRGEYYVLMLFGAVGMMLMAAARDLIVMFLALELMSISVYVLTGFNRKDPRSGEGAIKYFLLGAFSSAFFLYGIALVFGSTGSTNLSVITPLVGNGLAGNAMFLIGAALLLVGLGFKVAAVPFHMWAPDAYDGAPTPIAAFMATGVKAAAFAAFIRIFPIAFAGVYVSWHAVLWWLAVLTMFGANLIALTEGSVKRMLAYSSIAHAGYLLVALLSANPLGPAAFLFYLLVYTLMTVGAFGMVVANSRGGRERVALEDYAGFGWQQPLLGFAFAVLLFSLAGFPLTGGFIGKLYILRAALVSRQRTLAVLLVLASVISYFYYLRVVILMYMRPAPAEDSHRAIAVSGTTKFAVVAAAFLVLLLFFVPGPVLGAAQQSVASLFHTGSPLLGALH